MLGLSWRVFKTIFPKIIIEGVTPPLYKSDLLSRVAAQMNGFCVFEFSENFEWMNGTSGGVKLADFDQTFVRSGRVEI